MDVFMYACMMYVRMYARMYVCGPAAALSFEFEIHSLFGQVPGLGVRG